jgi:hypothetical protein
MTAEKLLGEAAAVVRDRRYTYRPAARSIRARGSSLVSGTRDGTFASTGDRLPGRSEGCQVEPRPAALDSITDIAGYAGCLAEVLSDA